jgi:glycine C-acetyltransferase
MASQVLDFPAETSCISGDARPAISAETHTLLDFYQADSGDLFEKCRRFHAFVQDLQRRGIYQAQYRVTLCGALDHRIRVRHPSTRREHEMICFDSNSYLGLHLHPRVLQAVRRALDRVGYGTPSAQLLSGTNRYLRELEETVSAFHGREETLIFPSGYAANIGALTAVLRPEDLVARDRYAHASIHDGCRWSGARYGGAYAHLDMGELERLLRDAGGCRGKLVVTDGVFSMHGQIAPLRKIREIADRHGARLMVDEAHSVGVIGRTGRGIEEHFGMPGSIDVLMGTFSKAPGSLGGYVCGSAELIDYLRFFARSNMFTASLPAPICAGLTEAFRVLQEEPEHRERLWHNARRLWAGLHDAGLLVPPLESPILTVFAGSDRLLWALSRELFDSGIKCGNVSYPAVPRGESILRLSVNARHTPEELDHTVGVLARLAVRYGIAGRSAEEVRAIGERLALPAPAQEEHG